MTKKKGLLSRLKRIPVLELYLNAFSIVVGLRLFGEAEYKLGYQIASVAIKCPVLSVEVDLWVRKGCRYYDLDFRVKKIITLSLNNSNLTHTKCIEDAGSVTEMQKHQCEVVGVRVLTITVLGRTKTLKLTRGV